MRACLLGALSTLMLAPFGPVAFADQNDPKLDELFTELNQLEVDEASRSDVRRIEREIWGLWYLTDNKAAKSYLMMGDQAMASGNLDLAIGAFSRAVENSPEVAETWNRRATAFYLAGQYERSLSDVNRVIELEPRHFGALSGAGQIYMAMGEHERALDALQAALKVNPHMPGPRIAVQRLTEKLAGDPI